MVVGSKRRNSTATSPPQSNASVTPSTFTTLSDGAGSAFLPYKPSVTVLTNLQRGNTEIKSRPYFNEELSFFQLAAKGDITQDQIQRAGNLDAFDRTVCGLTALMWASAYGQSHTVEDLLRAGVSVDLSNSDGHTALHFGAKAGYPDVIKALLSHGAQIDARDKRGNTPLFLASLDNHPLTVSFLLNSGADMTIINNEGETCYMISVSKQFSEVQQVFENQMIRLIIRESPQSFEVGKQ